MDLKKKVFVVITGASQGIGRSITIELSKCLGDGSTVVLMARNVEALNSVKASIASSNANVNVIIVAVDLTDPETTQYDAIFNIGTKFDYALIFHNVGQVGTLDAAIELTDTKRWRAYYDLNVFSVAVLNSAFVKHMRKASITQYIAVINISSLCGIKPFSNMAMYGSAKAARNLYFKVFALEESDVKVLNYCPGPVDTDMVSEVIATAKDESARKYFVELKTKNTILTPVQTVTKLLRILQEGSFASGDVVDYFDRE